MPFEIWGKVFHRHRGIMAIEKSLDKVADDRCVGTITHRFLLCLGAPSSNRREQRPWGTAAASRTTFRRR
jgi:hypothetical protein